MTIDIHTALLAAACIELVFVLAFLVIDVRHPRRRGVRWWLTSSVTSTLGFTLVAMRDAAPHVLTFDVANGMLMASTLAIWLGLRQFLGLSARVALFAAALLLAQAAHFALAHLWRSEPLSQMVFSVVGLLVAVAALNDNRRASPALKLESRIISLMFALAAMVNLARLVALAAGMGDPDVTMGGQGTAAFLFAFLVLGPTRLLMFIALLAARVANEIELKEADLLRSQNLLQNTLDSVEEGIVSVAPDGRMLLFNRRFKEIWNFTEEQCRDAQRATMRALVAERVSDPGGFEAATARIDSTDRPIRDTVLLKNGTVLARFGRPLVVDGERCHLWTFTDITSQRQIEESLRQSDERFRELTSMSLDWFWEQDEHLNFTFVSQDAPMARQVNFDPAPRLSQWELPIAGLSAAQQQEHRECLRRRLPYDDFSYRVRTVQGDLIWISVSGRPQFDGSGKFIGYRGTGHDITQRKRDELQRDGERHALEKLAEGASLAEFLNSLTACYERMFPEMLCSVMLADSDGRSLRLIAGETLPPDFRRLVETLPVAAGVSVCSTAAHGARMVTVEDARTDPLVEAFRDQALRHGLLSCCSQPIMSIAGRVLGTFAIYHRVAGPVPSYKLAVIERGAHLAALAVERVQY